MKKILPLLLLAAVTIFSPAARANENIDHHELKNNDLGDALNPDGRNSNAGVPWSEEESKEIEKITKNDPLARELLKDAIEKMTKSGMTPEDALTQLLQAIAEALDAEAQKLAERIKQLESGGGTTDTAGEKSVDVKAVELKRLADKRGQIFDTVQKVMDRYNETAKKAVQSLRG